MSLKIVVHAVPSDHQETEFGRPKELKLAIFPLFDLGLARNDCNQLILHLKYLWSIILIISIPCTKTALDSFAL